MQPVFRRAEILSLLLLCLAAPWAAASGPGTSAANFLKIPVGARETSLGGAFTAVADNADAVFYNPAGLGLLSDPELSYTYNNYLAGVSQQWLGAAYPVEQGTFGLGLNYLGVRAFDSYDSADNRTGSVSSYDLAAYLGYGGRFETGFAPVPTISYGGTAKYISEKLDTSKASGYGLDAGLLLQPAVKNLKVGVGLENLASSRLNFIGSGAKPPRKLKTGVSYGIGSSGDPVSSLVSLDFNFPSDGPRYLSAGIENTLYGALALRVGYSAFGALSNGLSFGLGFGLPGGGGREIRLDYSYGASYDLGNVHKFSLACRFGADRQAVSAEPPAPDREAEARAKAAADAFKRELDLLYNGGPLEARAAAEYLAGLDDQRVVDHFISLLYSGDPGRKLTAVHGLALQKDRRSLKALESALRDPDPEVRIQAALALGSRGGTDAALALQEALKNEETDSVKSAIIGALGKLGPASR